MRKSTGDVQTHCVVCSSQQKQKARMETKHPHGCFLCNQLEVRVSGGFNGSVRDHRARREKKKKKECCSALETDHFIRETAGSY